MDGSMGGSAPGERSTPAPAAIEAIDITRDLAGRPTREKDFAREVRAMRTIGASFGGSVDGVFQSLAREAMDLCGAASAGMTLTEQLPGGGLTVRWSALAGLLEGRDAPQIAWHESIGGAAIQHAAPLLFREPANAFPRLRDVDPPIREALAVPVPGVTGGLQPGRAGEGSAQHGASGHDQPQEDAPIGAVWVALHHGPPAEGAPGKDGFDREDARVLTALAAFAGAGAVAARLHEESRRALSRAERIGDELRRSNKDLEQFASIAAHDLREPLRGIRHHVEIVLEDGGDELSDASKDRLRKIDGLARRMHRMVGGLLEYARVGHEARPAEPTRLEGIVLEALDSVRGLLEQERVEVVVRPGLPVACCNPALITQAITNLVANGVKYNRSAAKRIEIAAEEKGAEHAGPCAEVVVSVRDNGIGLAREQAADPFRMFRRGAESERFSPGSGIGLAIVRRIVERHGGRLWAESEPGHGTTFSFTLPAGADGRAAE